MYAFIEHVSLINIINKLNTPLVIYSNNKLTKNIRLKLSYFKKCVYAIKANYNSIVFKILNNYGFGYETVSYNEICLLLSYGINSKKIVFSGVCKSSNDIVKSLSLKIGFLCVDSYQELQEYLKLSSKYYTRLIFRLNLNIDCHSHPRISTCMSDSKFGICLNVFNRKIFKILNCYSSFIFGIGFHLGSQIYSFVPFCKCFFIIKCFLHKLYNNLIVDILNIGGGFFVNYNKFKGIIYDFHSIFYMLNYIGFCKVIIEPGRSVVATTSIALTKAVYLKRNNNFYFGVLNTGMENFLRFHLYNSFHYISTVFNFVKPFFINLVGPICESTDSFGIGNYSFFKGSYFIIHDIGAYCISMRLNYNLINVPSEVFIFRSKWFIC